MSMYEYYGHHDFFLGGIISLLWLIVVIVLIVAAIRLLVERGMHGHWHEPPHGGRALDILKERYAKGEIDKSEYEEKKKVLSE